WYRADVVGLAPLAFAGVCRSDDSSRVREKRASCRACLRRSDVSVGVRLCQAGRVMTSAQWTRRQFLLAAAALAACRRDSSDSRSADSTLLGAARREYGERARFEHSARYLRPSATPGTGSSRTPLQDEYGMITPSSLHFE